MKNFSGEGTDNKRHSSGERTDNEFTITLYGR
jgi:hypothetical protein